MYRLLRQAAIRGQPRLGVQPIAPLLGYPCEGLDPDCIPLWH